MNSTANTKNLIYIFSLIETYQQSHKNLTPPFCWGEGGGGEPLTKYLQMGGLTSSRFLEGSCWESGG